MVCWWETVGRVVMKSTTITLDALVELVDKRLKTIEWVVRHEGPLQDSSRGRLKFCFDVA